MMTAAEIREHALQLQGHLDLKRRQVEHGDYQGSPEANLSLIAALENRIGELLTQCRIMENAQPAGTTVSVLI